MNPIRAHLRSNVVAYVALFFALGGSAYALGVNTVGSKQIKDRSVKGRDLARNAVSSPKVRNGSLRKADFAAGQLPRGATGPQGSPDTAQQVLDKVKQVDGVGSGLDADTLDGRDAAQLGSGRIHAVVAAPGVGVGVVPLGPGLEYSIGCYNDYMRINFKTSAVGTANAMIVASGVDAQAPQPNRFQVENGAQNKGFAYQFGEVTQDLADLSGNAAAESQIIIDSGANTYSIALHVFHIRDTDPNTAGDQYYCEAYGTATAGG